MDVIGRIGDLLTLVTFPIAFIALLAHTLRRGRNDASLVSWLLLAALAVYVVIGVSDALIWAKVTRFFEPYDDYLETLFPVIGVGIVFAAYSGQQYADLLRGQRALARSHGLMMDIVDGAPAGILFLDPNGGPVFANTTAKSVLDMTEDEETGSMRVPGWVEDGVEGARPGEMLSLVRPEPYDDVPVRLTWPDGWAVDLRASGRPLSDATDELGGVVVTFEKPRGL